MVRAALMLSVLALTTAACFGGKPRGEHGTNPGDMIYKVLSDEGRAPVAERDVQVFRAIDEPPPGFRRVGRFDASKKVDTFIEADGDYPSQADPHRVIGRLGVTRGSRVDDNAALQVLAKAAAEHGANGIVLVSESHRAFLGVAIVISDAEADPPLPAASEVLAETPERLQGFTPMGQPFERKLEAFEPVEWSAAPMRCYGLQLALDAGAALTPAAMKHLQAVPKGLERGTTEHRVTEDARIRDRSFAIEIGCTRSAAQAQLQRFQAMAVNKEAGTGAVQVRLFSRPSSQQEIAKRVAAYDKRVAGQQAAHDAAGRRIAAKACQRCLGVRLTQCRNGDPQGCGAFKSCLARSHVRPSECM